jgi:predicted TIM-barrel fold metal-dependent hydrolase
MPVIGSDLDGALRPLLRHGSEDLGPADWFDAHTHIGHHDPDGHRATPREILDGLDAAGHGRALLFAMHEPDGYRVANDTVLGVCERSDGRLEPLARISPNAEGAMREAERCLAAGARGFKLHPRSDGFGLPHPVVTEIVALAGAHRAPVLFHAGRGIPHLGEAVVDLARRNPGARLILAHAGISDLGWIAPHASELPNLFFDTAWWSIADQLALQATIPPGNILYGSDMPYAPGTLAAFMLVRSAASVGHGPAELRAMAGAQLARVVAGEDPLDLGPAPGPDALGERVIEAERVVAHASNAAHLAYRGSDPTEGLQLARLACRTWRTDAIGELLAAADHALAVALHELEDSDRHPMHCAVGALTAMVIAGTPAAGAPARV